MPAPQLGWVSGWGQWRGGGRTDLRESNCCRDNNVMVYRKNEDVMGTQKRNNKATVY